MPSTTQGRWQQSTPFGDGQIFLGAGTFKPTAASGAATIVSAGAGLLTLNMAASLTGNFFADISKLLRTGELATPAISQEQFGTAAAQPGPSSVAHTSGPLNLPGNPGFPPWLKSKMPTVSGNASTNDPIPKGLQVKSVDVIYEVDTLALTSATFGLTATAFPLPGVSAAPAVTNIIALGANGLPVAANTAGQATTTRILVTTPAFTVTPETELIANVNFVTPATSTIKFYGAILNVSFNYN